VLIGGRGARRGSMTWRAEAVAASCMDGPDAFSTWIADVAKVRAGGDGGKWLPARARGTACHRECTEFCSVATSAPGGSISR
jgi:hypothetical protein